MEEPNREALTITPNATLKAYLDLVFEDAGLAVANVQTLRDGLTHLKSHTPAIIVLDDLHEDGLDSAGFIWRIKRVKRLKHVPTIQIIHKTSERGRLTIEISGADHIVELPIKNSRFRKLIANLLSLSR
jgi:DNA-binding response OmpR family regulator